MKVSDVRKYALSLPEATEEPHHHFGSFRIRGKIFATLPPGDQEMNVFVDEQRRELGLSMFPDAYEKLWWGKNIVGLKVLLSKADVDDVQDLLRNAYARKAPKALVKQLS